MDLDPSLAGIGLIACEEIDSTNAEALRRSRAGERGPLWVTARSQSAGRGRRGRTWVSGPGNLYATLLVSDPSPPAVAPQLSFVAALALRDAVVDVAPGIEPLLKLKWPNDMLCDGAKVAGILVEGEGTPLSAAIGIGVNCLHHPEATDYPATDLAAAGVEVLPEHLFRALSAAMVLRLQQWDRGQSFAAIRADWLACAAGLGRAVRVRMAEREITGRFESLDDHGRLILALPNGRTEAVAAGDVMPLQPVSRLGEADAPPASARDRNR
jgi:BirA family transcriptional regulator, biotin operon repressor / biotin---[acetyl-CoA-carboxylase] ligase